MAPAEKKKRGSTPGRPKRKGNEYFDLGKVGRKTGITLEDKGIRDEHGLEPMEHIFSSPVRNVDGTMASADELMQESSGPSVDRTLTSRKTPRLPPPRASTPKYTHIGSPKRMSTGQRRPAQSDAFDLAGSPTRPRTQPANRLIDFNADAVHKSIESPSPFKPKNALRRSIAQQDHPFASPSKPSSDAVAGMSEPVIQKIDNDEDVQVVDDGPLLLDDDNYYDAMPEIPDLPDDEPEQDESEQAEAGASHASPPKSRTLRPRTSIESVNNSTLQQTAPLSAPSTSSKKRDRSVLDEEQEEGDDQGENEQSLLNSQLSVSAPAQKKARGRPSRRKTEVIIHHRNGDDETIDPALLAYGDAYEADSALEAALQIPPVEDEPKGKGKGKGKGKQGKASKQRTVTIHESPSKLRNERSQSRPTSRQGSMGPMNNYHLRATTPFEDAGERTSRYGRNLIQPLKYWANESRIYRHGEIEGIVRAEEVEVPKVKRPKKKTKKRINKLDDVEEDSDTDSVMADEWEDEVGVIAGMVANWDPATQMGDPQDLTREDLAFATSSIVTREVKGSEFKYAKILTLPFFGSGVVEIPPKGFKRVKNSRKMQQCFFVHEGKVLVEVGAASVDETTRFAISKGGVWVVPRGNDYAITNESSTKTARIFFAQGCEVESLAERLEETAV